MTESREELIEAMARALWDSSHSGFVFDEASDHVTDQYRAAVSIVLDALLAHPRAVLSELENSPCQTCGGDKFMRDAYGRPTEDDCSAWGGSGKLGRDGVLQLLGMEEVGSVDLRGYCRGLSSGRARDERVTWAARPVPEPSEGER